MDSARSNVSQARTYPLHQAWRIPRTCGRRCSGVITRESFVARFLFFSFRFRARHPLTCSWSTTSFRSPNGWRQTGQVYS